MASLTVLGLGNIMLQDKGLGIYAVRDLHQEEWPREVSFVDRMMLGHSSLDLDGVQGLVVLDAFTTGQEPGRLRRFTSDDMAEYPEIVQDPWLWKSLALAQMLGQKLEVIFLGLEAKKTEYNLFLSHTVSQAYAHYLQMVRNEISSLLQELGTDVSAHTALA